MLQHINICQVPRFQHLPWDLENVNAWKTMFDPIIMADTHNAQANLILIHEAQADQSTRHSYQQ